MDKSLKYVYEVRDTSNDEIYHSLGMFTSLDEVKEQLLKFDKDSGITETDDDYEEISVYRRLTTGWDGGGKGVFTICRERNYQEETGNYYWELVEQNEF